MCAMKRSSGKLCDPRVVEHAAKFESDMSEFSMRVLDVIEGRSALEAAIYLDGQLCILHQALDRLVETGMLTVMGKDRPKK